MLFLAVTGADAIWKTTLLANGDIAKADLHPDERPDGPDGLAIDDDDLAVCQIGFGAVWSFSAGESRCCASTPRTDT